MPLVRSLNVHVPWHQVLRALQMTARAPALPTTTDCPACRGSRLVIFPDQTYGGQWHYCQDCLICGDMIELAARVWSLSVEAALLKLANISELDSQHLRPEALLCYQKHYPDYRAKWRKMWQESQRNLVTGAKPVSAITHALGVRCTDPPDRFAAGTMQLYGSSDRDTIEKLMHPAAFGTSQIDERRPNRKPRNPSAFRVFKGAKWGPVLCFPYYDLPGRLRSFLFVGREAQLEDRVYRRLSPNAVSKLPPEELEFGLAMHPGAVAAAVDWDNQVFAFEDAVLAAKLQIKRFHNALVPLPVVSWHDSPAGRTRHAWSMLRGCQVVFWCEQLEYRVVRQVLHTGGKICLAPRGERGPRYWIADEEPRKVLKRICELAQPWPQLLSEQLLEMPSNEVEELFLQLQLRGEDTSVIFQQITPEAAGRVQRILQQNAPPNSFWLDRRAIVETADGWFAERPHDPHRELISAAVLRIDEIIYQQRLQQTFYRGRVLYKGQEFGFCERRELLERQPFRWLQDLLIRNGQGLLQHSPTWAKRLVAIAAQFHPAKITSSVDTIGWDGEHSRFVLADYVLEIGGQITAHAQVPVSKLALPAKFPLPQVPTPVEVSQLTPFDWAVQTCVLANVLAPAFHRPTSGIAILGPAGLTGGLSWASAVGCPILPLGSQPAQETALEAETAHGWPIIVTWKAPQRNTWIRWLEGSQAARNSIMGVSESFAATLAVHGGWHLIPGGASGSPLSLLPGYLQDLAKRRLEWTEEESWLGTVYRELYQWATGELPTTQPAWLEDLECGHAEPVGRLVAQAALDGLVVLTPAAFVENVRTQLARDAERQAIFVSRPLLAHVAGKRGLPEFDPVRVGRVLRHAGVLVGEDQFGGFPGWWLGEAWWHTQLQSCRAATAQLKLHG